MALFDISGDEILLRVRATPGATKDDVKGMWAGPEGDERLVVRVTAPPEDGRANRAVAKVLAQALGLPKSSVSLRAGAKDRLKTFAIVGDVTEIRRRLEALAAGQRVLRS